jgi:hypothetical protein
LTVRGAFGGVIASGANVTASNLVLYQNVAGIAAGYGGSVRLTDSVIDGGAIGDEASSDAGGVVMTSGSTVTLEGVDVRAYSPALITYDSKTVLTLNRSLVSYVGPASTSQVIAAWAGSSIVLNDSAASTRAASLVAIGASFPGDSGPPASITVRSSQLAQTGLNLQGLMMWITAGASLTIEDSTVLHQSWEAIAAGGAGTRVNVKSSVIAADPTFDVIRAAVEVGTGASATIDGSAIVSPIQTGLLAGDPGSSMTISRSLVKGTAFVGPGPDARLMGSGIAIGVGKSATLKVTDTSLVENQQFGLYVASGSVAEASGLLLDGTVVAAMPGAAVLAEAGAKLSMSGSLLRKNAESGLACEGGGVVVGKTSFVDNKIALGVVKSVVVESAGAPPGNSPEHVILYDNQFTGNASKEGPPPYYTPGAGTPVKGP